VHRYQISIISFTSYLKYHKPHIKQILVHIIDYTRNKKILIEITLFSPFVVKTPKREKSCEAKMRCRLLVVLCLLIVAGLLLIVIVRNMSRAIVEGSQLSRSQRGVGVGDKLEDMDVRELLERLVPLVVNNLLVAPHNL
jgi:hypothetical protein